jgi:transcriptional regulator with XRE-family HTH domain
MLGKAGLSDKRINVFQDFAHRGNSIARVSVHVNARHNVNVATAQACYKFLMQENWFARLEETIQADGRSLRKLSEDAKCGPNFVQQLLKDKKDPRASQLSKLLAALGREAEFYVLTGLRLSQGDLEFVSLVSGLEPGARQDVLSLMQRLAAHQEPAASEELQHDLTE